MLNEQEWASTGLLNLPLKTMETVVSSGRTHFVMHAAHGTNYETSRQKQLIDESSRRGGVGQTPPHSRQPFCLALFFDSSPLPLRFAMLGPDPLPLSRVYLPGPDDSCKCVPSLCILYARAHCLQSFET